MLCSPTSYLYLLLPFHLLIPTLFYCSIFPLALSSRLSPSSFLSFLSFSVLGSNLLFFLLDFYRRLLLSLSIVNHILLDWDPLMHALVAFFSLSLSLFLLLPSRSSKIGRKVYNRGSTNKRKDENEKGELMAMEATWEKEQQSIDGKEK